MKLRSVKYNGSVIYCKQSKVPAHVMKAYAESGIDLHLLNFSIQYSRGQFRALAALNGYRGPFHPAEVQGERALIIHSIEAWVSSKALDVKEEKNLLLLLRTEF